MYQTLSMADSDYQIVSFCFCIIIKCFECQIVKFGMNNIVIEKKKPLENSRKYT